MHSSTIIAAIAGLAASTQAQIFSIRPLSIDQRLTPPSIQINFTVSAPGTSVYNGGPEPAQCNLTLPGRGVGTCWNKCGASTGSQYYARVTPSSFNSTSSYSLDIWQSYVYELGNHNNATIPISTTDACIEYTCTKELNDNVCQTGQDSEGFNGTYTAYYGGADPPQDQLCIV
ncbi:hypothetical protein LTR17_021019 [Elasticomyces elasticus]|nr:hypothetical protein LTR17_021019 [Elasticomyces elasticus]